MIFLVGVYGSNSGKLIAEFAGRSFEKQLVGKKSSNRT
jgi:hypothetical protein